MEKASFVLALVLLVGAVKINAQVPTELTPLTPPDLLIEPVFDEKTPPAQQINGRILTPAEGCGKTSYGVPRVVGGGPAKNGGFPWMAFLAYHWPLNPTGVIFACGGSLISSKHVLTAAHCVKGSMWFARFGEHDYRHTHDGPHQDVPIASSDIHPDYNRTVIVNDIALLTLAHHVTFNKRVRPICIPFNTPVQERNFEGSNPFVAGWGIVSEGGELSPYLKQVQVPVIRTDECDNSLRSNGGLWSAPGLQINEKVVCAGNVEGQTSCKGDSGGPLMLPINHGDKTFPFFQVGVVSWGMPCGKKGTPTVYTSVQHFGKWILSKMT